MSTRNLSVIVCDICGLVYHDDRIKDLTIDLNAHDTESDCIVDHLAGYFGLWREPTNVQRDSAVKDGWTSQLEEVHRGWLWRVDRCPDCHEEPYPAGFMETPPVETKTLTDAEWRELCGNCTEDPRSTPKSESQCPLRRYGRQEAHTIRCKHDIPY